jgi:purine-binding chemotaxis protein CheW
LVDSVAEVLDIKMSEIETAPNVGNDESSRYIDGVVSRGDKLLILVDLDKLLSEAEWGSISSM